MYVMCLITILVARHSKPGLVVIANFRLTVQLVHVTRKIPLIVI